MEPQKEEEVIERFGSCHTINSLCLGSGKELVNVQGNNRWWF
jgi:hypothetical protein